MDKAFCIIQNTVSDYNRIYPFNETDKMKTYEIYMHPGAYIN